MMRRFCVLNYYFLLSVAQLIATTALLFVKELDFWASQFTEIVNSMWRGEENQNLWALSPVHHSDISRYSVQCCGIQNKSFILQLFSCLKCCLKTQNSVSKLYSIICGMSWKCENVPPAAAVL